MLYADFKDFVAALPVKGRLLGIDWGAKRMGFAVSTPERTFVFAHSQLAVSSEQLSIDKVLETVNSEQIVGIIVGLPVFADGTDSNTTVKVREFAAQLAAAVSAPVAFVEENLTSVAAVEIAGRDKNIDSAAAAVILENAIAMIKRAMK